MKTESFDLADSIRRHITYSLGLTSNQLTPRDLFHAGALAVRDRMIDGRLATERRQQRDGAKRLYYLSMEFLIGRSFVNNLTNLGLLDVFRAIASDYRIDPGAVEESEVDAALGNGGLGRLAACYLDSLATLGYAGFGYGINYEFGLFRQEIRNGAQVESPDNWRTYASPWILERPQDAILVPLYGRVEHTRDRAGGYNPMWLDWRVVIGVPHDMPIVGFGGHCVNLLRLFVARASHEVDMTSFSEGDYISAAQQKVTSETISKVLYPSEAVATGRELRLVQEYFLVACSVRDMVRQYLRENTGFDQFPTRVAVQLNDTHPTLAVAELMRQFIDEHNLNWERAWELTEATFGYTNHTLLPEALERWPVSLLEHVLPRHMQIIFEINHRFLKEVDRRWPGDSQRSQRMSMIEESGDKQVRMAHLAIAGSHAVNGVSAVHSRLVATTLVPDFAALWPHKFTNVTNGVTPRRWLLAANPGLARIITDAIGEQWVTNLDLLRGLEKHANDSGFRELFRAVKRANKERLAAQTRNLLGLASDPDALFDVHVKRIHEYKRQLLNLLHVVDCYLRLIAGEDMTPRFVIFAGKAAPGYRAAKEIIRLIHDVARVINADPRAKDKLQIAFLPDYRVTLAERIIPAADLSEQISTAGTEASGTGNMKFALNGALTIGTLDGANIEMRDAIGADDFFIFGLTVEQVREERARGYRPRDVYQRSAAVRRVMDAFRDGVFCPKARGQHQWVCDKLLADGEPYFHLADLDAYLAAQTAAARRFVLTDEWTASAIRNVARIGYFSSDRAIHEYARRIWGLQPPKQ